jgi:hypothetical protein
VLLAALVLEVLAVHMAQVGREQIARALDKTDLLVRFVLFTPDQLVHSHQPTQVICNGTLYSY